MYSGVMDFQEQEDNRIELMETRRTIARDYKAAPAHNNSPSTMSELFDQSNGRKGQQLSQ